MLDGLPHLLSRHRNTVSTCGIIFWTLLIVIAIVVGIPCFQFAIIYPMVYHFEYVPANTHNYAFTVDPKLPQQVPLYH